MLKKIVIASGKGGTGKTTVATNLARVAPDPVCYVDCDVEEPNGHLFLNPEIAKRIPISVKVPRVDYDLCTFCGKCAEACRYNAIAVLPKSVMVFEELCHSCGGCVLACPESAIREESREIGAVEVGNSAPIGFLQGRLNVGEAMSPPLIREVKARLPGEGLAVIDAPPGTSCPVIAAIHGAHFCLLVTEPTPFGLNDLALAVEMVRAVGIPHAVAINRHGIGDDAVEEYCHGEGIPVILRIPDDRGIAEAYSRGELAVDAFPKMRGLFADLLRSIDQAMEAGR